MAGDYYTDAEVDELCDGLVQDAAKIRYLRDVLKLRVNRKPNGRPLAWRPEPVALAEAQNDDAAPNVLALRDWAKKRGQRGQKTQG
jgi:hypothetical protein